MTYNVSSGTLSLYTTTKCRDNASRETGVVRQRTDGPETECPDVYCCRRRDKSMPLSFTISLNEFVFRNGDDIMPRSAHYH